MLKKYKLENKLLNSNLSNHNNNHILEISKQISMNKYNRKIFINNLILILFLMLFLVLSIIYFSIIIAFNINVSSNHWIVYLSILIVFAIISASIGSYNLYGDSFIGKRIPKMYLKHQIYLHSFYALNVKCNVFHIDKIRKLLSHEKLFNFTNEHMLLVLDRKVNTTKLKTKFSLYFPYSILPFNFVSFILSIITILLFFKVI